MAKHDKKTSRTTTDVAARRKPTAAGHHAAKAHGSPRPSTRRCPGPARSCSPSSRRAPAPRRGPARQREHREAVDELERIEIQIADVERAMDPPPTRLTDRLCRRDRVRIYEVGPRDGLQNEATPIPTGRKRRFIELLVDRRPARDRGDELRVAEGDPAAGRCRRAAAAARARARRPLPGPRPERARHGPRRGRRRRRARRLHRRDRRLHDAEHRDDGRRIARGLRAGPRARRRARLVAPRLRLDRVRLPVHRAPSTRHRAVDVALRLLDLGVDEVCFGDTIGVGVPGPGRRRSRARRWTRGSRSTRSRTTSTTRAARPSRTSRPGSTPGVRCFDARPAAPAAVRTRRAPPAISPPRTSCTCSTRPGYEHGVSTSSGVLEAARFIADALGRPLASKVGQAGGWDPADRRRRSAARAANLRTCTIRARR